MATNGTREFNLLKLWDSMMIIKEYRLLLRVEKLLTTLNRPENEVMIQMLSLFGQLGR
jgi:hypothetical protein